MVEGRGQGGSGRELSVWSRSGRLAVTIMSNSSLRYIYLGKASYAVRCNEVQSKLRHASRFIHSLRVSPFVAFFYPSSLGSTIMLHSSFATSVFFFASALSRAVWSFSCRRSV
jgi:hypothetical protein